MNRLLIALLTAFDAAIAAAAGVAVVLAPVTLLWVFGVGGQADWSALWPVAAAVWQLGHLVPLSVSLPDAYLAATGIPADAAAFTLSLAPLAFAAFTTIFAARSGARASRAEGWITGVLVGTVVFAAFAALIAFTSGTRIAAVAQWQAVLFPTLLFALPALAGAVFTEWREAGSGVVARLRDRVETQPHGWGEVPGLAVRGAAIVVAGLVGLGALGVAVMLVVSGAQVIALFEAGQMDVLGATLTTLAQLAYLPTLIIWAVSFVAGPGFAVGSATAVSPAGTQVGVLPGIPVLGALPESISPWLLLLALLPVALGAFAGWVARSNLVQIDPPAPSPRVETQSAPWATAALEGLIGAPPAIQRSTPPPTETPDEPIAARFTLALSIAVLSSAAVALLAFVASGSIGPGALADVGPQAGAVALAVGLEVLLGASILLLSPRRRPSREDDSRWSFPGRAENSPTDAATARQSEWIGAAAGADEYEVSAVIAEAWATTSRGAVTDLAWSAGDSWPDTHDTAPMKPLPVPDVEPVESAPQEPLPPLVPRAARPGDAPAPRRPAPLPPLD